MENIWLECIVSDCDSVDANAIALQENFLINKCFFLSLDPLGIREYECGIKDGFKYPARYWSISELSDELTAAIQC